MILVFAVLLLQSSQFSVRMNQYINCVSATLPADMASRDLQARTLIYRRAVSRCQSERQSAIDAAVAGREPGTSAEAARALAIDIIDTLDPQSNAKGGK